VTPKCRPSIRIGIEASAANVSSIDNRAYHAEIGTAAIITRNITAAKCGKCSIMSEPHPKP
jgi:hypothetical protein